MFCPFLFEVHNPETFEEFFPSSEIVFYCGEQETLAETAWTGKEDILTPVGQVVDNICLVDIYGMGFDYIGEILLSDWISQIFSLHSANIKKFY